MVTYEWQLNMDDGNLPGGKIRMSFDDAMLADLRKLESVGGIASLQVDCAFAGIRCITCFLQPAGSPGWLQWEGGISLSVEQGCKLKGELDVDEYGACEFVMDLDGKFMVKPEEERRPA